MKPERTAGLSLRPANPQDRGLLFDWTNDPQTRRGSFRTAPIEPDAHNAWFSQALDGARHLFIAESPETGPVGVLRLDPVAGEPETAEIGITVAPERRREGLAPRILRAGRATASALGYTLLVARIRADNPVSRRVFEEVGFELAAEQVIHGTRALRYHWSLSEN